jgi:hypothetical protein
MGVAMHRDRDTAPEEPWFLWVMIAVMIAAVAIMFVIDVIRAHAAEAEASTSAQPRATLVITMSTDHGEFERQDEVDSLTECWRQARDTMEHMRAAKVHDGLVVTSIGVGCVVNVAPGDPA